MKPSFKSNTSYFIKSKAKELGFDFCGIAKAEFLEEEVPPIEDKQVVIRNLSPRNMDNLIESRLQLMRKNEFLQAVFQVAPEDRQLPENVLTWMLIAHDILEV